MDYANLASTRNRENPFSRFLGAETIRITHGQAEAILSVKPEHTNMYGIIHGGCLYTLADIAAGSAVASHGCKAVTATGEYLYLAPAKTARVKAIAKTIKQGHHLAVTEVDLLSEDGIHIGRATFVHMVLESYNSEIQEAMS